jgi:hypothetical protein
MVRGCHIYWYFLTIHHPDSWPWPPFLMVVVTMIMNEESSSILPVGTLIVYSEESSSAVLLQNPFLLVVRTTFLPFDCRLAQIRSFCILNLKMVTFRTSSVNLWHLGVDLSFLRCKKRFRGGHIPLKKLLWAPPIVHTLFTSVACWKLKGLSASVLPLIVYTQEETL